MIFMRNPTNCFQTLMAYILLAVLSVLGHSKSALANGAGGIDRGGRGGGGSHHGAGHDPGDVERVLDLEFTTAGDSRSVSGDASVRTAGFILEAEYEKNYKIFSFAFERWQYDWRKPQNLPFISASGVEPWNTFYTLALGFEYEMEINPRWELQYYIEAESSFENETSNSNEYEIGVDIDFEPNRDWVLVLNFNYEYLDAEGAELGMDMEIEWKPHNQKGWSGVFEVSSEFPESSLTYHFTPAFSTSFFFNEGGTNTIRLSDNSPVLGMRGGYLEDEYRRVGARLSYHWGHESFLSFSIENTFDRQMAFVDRNGNIEAEYEFEDALGFSLNLSYEF